jgi:hypothetical protein
MPIEIISTRFPKIEFPKLMILSDDEGDTIVLMHNEYGKGNGIATNAKAWENNMETFYETSCGWMIEKFKDFTETLTIKNK